MAHQQIQPGIDILGETVFQSGIEAAAERLARAVAQHHRIGGQRIDADRREKKFAIAEVYRCRQLSADDAGQRCNQFAALASQGPQRAVMAVPLEQRELRFVAATCLAVTKYLAQLPDVRRTGGQQPLHVVFGRGVQPELAAIGEPGRYVGQMRIADRMRHQCRRFNLEQAARA